ncbi:hypothetical protein Ancab_002212 [Ancistrocladus abbreviatus]
MMRGPTSAFSSGSPIPVLLSAKHPWPRGSGGIRAVSAARAKSSSGGTQDYDEGSDKCAFVRVTHPRCYLSAKHPWLRGSGGIRAVSTGVIAPISHPSRFVPDPSSRVEM